MKILFCLFASVFSLTVNCFSQDSASYVFNINRLPTEGILLDKGWKFHEGDNLEWSKSTFNDKNWKSINPTKDIHDIPELWKANIVWFRFHFTLDSSLSQKGIALLIKQTGASEFFLNGQLIKQFGKISDDRGMVQAVTPAIGSFIGLPVNKSGDQVLAVRFAIQKNIPYVVFAGRPNQTLALEVIETDAISSYLESNITVYFDFTRTGLFLILSVLHLSLFFFNPSQKANLYFLIYAIVNCLGSFLAGIVYTHVHFATTKTLLLIFSALVVWLSFLFFLTAVYKTFNYRRGLIYWMLY